MSYYYRFLFEFKVAFLIFSNYIKLFLTCTSLVVACVFYAQNSVYSTESTLLQYQDDTLFTEDSTTLAIRRADSIASYRSYIKSKRYNDSIDAWRKARMDSIRTENQRKVDSSVAERQRIMDSSTVERNKKNDSLQAAIQIKQELQKKYLDSLNAIRQVTMDSLNALKEYRNSKQFKDSVSIAQKEMIDSIKAVKKAQIDSLTAIRQLQIDSLMTDRIRKSDSLTVYLDSLKEDRMRRVDSLKLAHQARVDSFEKVKEAREDMMAEKDKEKKAEKRKEEMDKIQKERDAYTNETMRKKKWSFLRKIYQNTTTRYNYYFNANNKMKEAEDNMYRAKVDNYDSLIALHPFNPDTDSMLMRNDMDSLLQRIGVGIQIHDPRARWQDDLYLLLGKSFYYKGDYKNAAAAFQFIVASALQEDAKKGVNKKKGTASELISKEKQSNIFTHLAVKNDAILWLATVYIQEKNFGKAQILLDMVSGSANLSDRLKGALEECYASYYLAQGMPYQALPYLDSMTYRTDLDPKLRSRSGYLAGQLYQASADNVAASRIYDKVLDLHPPIEMDFKATLNKLLAEAQSQESDKVLRTLRKMAKETKFKIYFDQIFYSLGNVQTQNGLNADAIESYRSSIQAANNNAQQKGKSYFAMAELYYQSKEYRNAKNAYDSAMVFLEKEDGNYRTASTRGNILSAITIPATKVADLDSLITLAAMTEQEQSAHIKQVLKKMKEATTPEMLSAVSGTTTLSGSSSPGSWYFANESMAAKGEDEFKTKWGNRKLKDNWRRGIGSAGSAGADVTTWTDETATKESKEITEAELLALIPRDPKIIDSLKFELENQYFLLGKAFFNGNEIEDAATTYDILLQKFPQFAKKDEIYYDRYIMALRNNNPTLANEIKAILLKEFPHSSKAKLLMTSSKPPTEDNANIMDLNGINNHLDQTYALLKSGAFEDVIIRYEEVKSIFPVQAPRFMDKYALMRAIAIAGNGNYGRADSLLTEIIAINANDSLTNWAKEVHKYIKSQLPLASEKPSSVGSGTSLLDPSIVTKEYAYNPNEVHYMMAYAAKADGRFMGLRAGISDYNSLMKSDLSLSSSLSDLMGAEKIFVIKDFKNSADALAYMADVKKEKDLLSAFSNPSEVTYAIISEGNYNLLMVQKKMADYLTFYFKTYR